MQERDEFKVGIEWLYAEYAEYANLEKEVITCSKRKSSNTPADDNIVSDSDLETDIDLERMRPRTPNTSTAPINKPHISSESHILRPRRGHAH